MTRTLRIGTRGSALALVQARWVAARLAEHGVRHRDRDHPHRGRRPAGRHRLGRGRLRRPHRGGAARRVGRPRGALRQGRPDRRAPAASRSPRTRPARTRATPSSAASAGPRSATLPIGARVGTDSPRRVAFLRALRPDLEMHPLHGNVDTRLAKLDRGDSDALVLAVAGLTRLGRADRIDDILPARPRRLRARARARWRSRCAPTTPRRSRPSGCWTTRRPASRSRPSARS